MHGLHLLGEEFSRIYPFGILAERGGRILQLGAALARRVELEPEAQVLDHFELTQPIRAKGVASLAPGAHKEIALKLGPLELRGRSVPHENENILALLCSPIVRSLEELKLLGLRLADFPPDDATPNFLLSMQATKTALEDARGLSEKLRTALASSEAAAEAKSRFLAVMSHELRTPLGGIGSVVDLLRGSDRLGDHEHSLLDLMDSSVRDLGRILSDVLDFSKIEAGSIELEALPVGLEQLFGQGLGSQRASAQEKNLEFVVRVDPDLPGALVSDPLRLRQILTNLIGNAIKFTSSGSVEVTADRTGPDVWQVRCTDTGIGIAAESQAGLFEPFSQADSSTTRHFGGSGLGLAIARDLARAMGGDLSLERSDENGTCFLLELPLVEAAPGALEAAGRKESKPDDLAGFRVLVAEDSPLNQRLLSMMLSQLGIDATFVEDGQEALEAVQGGPFDLVLMDMMMPNMDGAEATRHIRALDVEWKDLPIIACTASAFEEDRQRAFVSGMSDFLEKPVRLRALGDVLRRHLDRKAAGARSA